MHVLLLILAALAGALLPIQAGMNVRMGRHTPSPLAAALVSFAVGAGVLAIAHLASPRGNGWRPEGSPWWAWVGGIVGAAYIGSSIVLGARLGAAELLAAGIAGTMVASLLIDHFGWVGFVPRPASWNRILGAGLVVAGVVLVARPWDSAR